MFKIERRIHVVQMREIKNYKIYSFRQIRQFHHKETLIIVLIKRNLRIPKWQTEIVQSEDRQDHGQQNETKDKHRTHNTTLKTKARVTHVKIDKVNGII